MSKFPFCLARHQTTNPSVTNACEQTIGWLTYKMIELCVFSFRVCYFTSESVSNKACLMSMINHSFGSGGMTSALDTTQIVEFVQYLQRSHEEPLPVKKAILATRWDLGSKCDHLHLSSGYFSVQPGDGVPGQKHHI